MSVPKAEVVQVGGKRVLHVMATVQEYTGSLRRKITPLVTGVGPVEGGIALGAALAELSARRELPDFVVTLGSGGSAKLEHLCVYQGAWVSYRDMDCSPIGFERGVTPFSTAPAVLALGPRVPGLPSASIASGASIVSGAAYVGIEADMVDMETYAYARAGLAFAVPVIALRGVSDGRAPLQGYSDWHDSLVELGERLTLALDQTWQAIERDAFE